MTETVTRSEAAPIVLGAVAFGKPKPTTREHPLASDDSCEALVSAFVDYGGREIDTARVYQNGNCEAVLGRIPSAASLLIATKYHPNLPGGPLAQLDESLLALRASSIPLYYIHMPPTELHLEDVLGEINQGYQAGKFEEFGLSNFPAWQVVEICQYCHRRGYVLPTVYQGVYNALNRTAEYELVPVLRNYGIRYYTHGSLASGFLTGKYKQGVAPVKGEDRFAQSRRIKQYEQRYLKREEMFSALHAIASAAGEHDITALEAAVRWTQHHSAADGALGDAILIGVSRIEQLDPIMTASKKGPLPESVVEAFEVANDVIKMKSEYYLQYPYPKEGSPWRSRY
ncbi:MAG: aldo/keto reductase [Pseudomonadales bacterium]|jgi:aflatoxin B1 aldehyde reductase|nr:aldo/keto reductase [Pseudomonadales bacterium]MDP6471104.1 aldo/keto reductase [Pseudomonadales bacterium]MDP6825710.1 aldo/keto reductase [Pseudomonadales bacterium]MDP6973166.1 aldo/keto reductase [Pseudomonadales bacterium]|tara:strand:+ start:3639 stop:4664 length:1026 start_codon:yes stop_codon:yes gene_type:complete